MTDRKAITEEQGVHKAWPDEAKKQTVETLPEFIRHLTEDYEHDYGTICHAMSAAALAAAYAVNSSPQGGITGFQSGFVMWGFVAEWLHKKGAPLRLVDYDDLLYPQYAEKFTTISAETWKSVQEKARAKLTDDAHPNVVAHWKTIVDGIVPFGLIVKD